MTYFLANSFTIVGFNAAAQAWYPPGTKWMPSLEYFDRSRSPLSNVKSNLQLSRFSICRFQLCFDLSYYTTRILKNLCPYRSSQKNGKQRGDETSGAFWLSPLHSTCLYSTFARRKTEVVLEKIEFGKE